MHRNRSRTKKSTATALDNPAPSTSEAPDTKVTFYGARVAKADSAIVVNDILHQEDDFTGLYWSAKSGAQLVLEPPYNPVTLQALTQRNNILSQCVAAMEVNIDGTGYTIEPVDQTKKGMAGNAPEQKQLEDFFGEPYPDTSFISMRRELRYDVESTGNGYLEVLRNLEGNIVFLRGLDSTTMRLCRLDEPVLVEKQITRGTDTFSTKVSARERRFVQKVGTKLVFFKEFGASRQLDRNTGAWIEGTTKLDPSVSASEVIHFTCEKDTTTPYGVPRWINQLPSIMGSRKAEEFNLEFFDSGGVPPAVVFVQGGALSPDVTKQLNGFFAGNGKAKHRVAVVEVQSSSGSLDSAGTVQVKTERFGDTKSNDSMFQNYDKACEDHVRVGFRLPPLFLGKAQDYNFATAQTAYMVTEAQVFQPERTEFDEIINIKIVRSLGVKDYVIKSNPLTMKSVDVQLNAIEKVKDLVDDAELVATVNGIVGTNLKYSKEKVDAAAEAQAKALDAQNQGQQQQSEPPVRGKPNLTAVKSEMNPTEIVGLVSRWNVAVGIQAGIMDVNEKQIVLTKVATLEGEELDLFNNVLASKSFLGFDVGLGLDDIACGCSKAMTAN